MEICGNFKISFCQSYIQFKKIRWKKEMAFVQKDRISFVPITNSRGRFSIDEKSAESYEKIYNIKQFEELENNKVVLQCVMSQDLIIIDRKLRSKVKVVNIQFNGFKFSFQKFQGNGISQLFINDNMNLHLLNVNNKQVQKQLLNFDHLQQLFINNLKQELKFGFIAVQKVGVFVTISKYQLK